MRFASVCSQPCTRSLICCGSASAGSGEREHAARARNASVPCGEPSDTRIVLPRYGNCAPSFQSMRGNARCSTRVCHSVSFVKIQLLLVDDRGFDVGERDPARRGDRETGAVDREADRAARRTLQARNRACASRATRRRSCCRPARAARRALTRLGERDVAAQRSGSYGDGDAVRRPARATNGRSSCRLSSATAGAAAMGDFCIGSALRSRRRNDEKNEKAVAARRRCSRFSGRRHALASSTCIATVRGRIDATHFRFDPVSRRACSLRRA